MKAIIKTDKGCALLETSIPSLNDPNAVLIRVLLAGLCRTDLYAAQNRIPVQNDIILGHELCGIVVQAGDNVKNIHCDQRVGVMPIFKNATTYSMLGIDKDGAFAEYVLVPADNVYPVPEHFTDEEAAFLEPIAACLAVSHAPINPEQKGLIYGENRISELTRRILYAKGFHSLDLCTPNQMRETVSQYDFIVETTPTGDAFEHMMQLIKPQGTIVLKSRPFLSIPMPITAIVQKEVQLIGAHYGDFQEGIDLLNTQRLNVNDLFGDIYSLEEAIPILSATRKVSEDKKIFFRP